MRIIVDAHSDFPMHVVRKRELGQKRVIESNYYTDLSQGNVNAVVAAVFLEDRYIPELALKEGLKQVAAMRIDIEESPDKLSLCTTSTEVEQAIKQGKTAIILAFEGLEPIQRDLELLKVFYDLGVRICGLTWSRRNMVADGCGFEREEKSIKSGLTDFGRQVVAYAEELGMIIDVTHLSEAAFWDTLSIVQGPVIASHTNCQGIFNIKRNFTDAQIKAIAEKNGVICINGVSGLAVPYDRGNSVEVIVDHMDYIKTLVGIDHVGMGLDLYPSLVNSQEKLLAVQDGVQREIVDLVPGYSHLHTLIAALVRRGYTNENISKVMGENFLRVFGERNVRCP